MSRIVRFGNWMLTYADTGPDLLGFNGSKRGCPKDDQSANRLIRRNSDDLDDAHGGKGDIWSCECHSVGVWCWDGLHSSPFSKLFPQKHVPTSNFDFYLGRLWHANLHKNGFLTSPVWKHGLWSQVDGWTVPFSIYVNDGRGRSLGDPGWNVLDPLSITFRWGPNWWNERFCRKSTKPVLIISELIS